jgi:hypothetical protein
VGAFLVVAFLWWHRLYRLLVTHRRDTTLKYLIGNGSLWHFLLLILEPLTHISSALYLRDNKELWHLARRCLSFCIRD